MTTESEAACRLVRSLVARAIVVIAALAVFFSLRRLASPSGPGTPTQSSPVAARIRPTRASGLPTAEFLNETSAWMALHLLGVAMLLYPLFMISVQEPEPFFRQSLLPWILGSLFGAVGAMLWVAPAPEWRLWLARERYLPILIAAIFFVLPDIAELALPLWNLQTLASLTFTTVSLVLSLVGSEVYADPDVYVIGLNEFFVEIGQPCSGVEGLALTASFVGLYAVLFKADLRFPLYWLVVLPAALLASWTLNVLRVSGLILIGAWVSPAHAVNGFHSYAGWMFFTLLSLTFIWAVHSTPFLRLQRSGQSVAGRLGEDWLAARILPFLVFLVTGIIGAALTIDISFASPYRAIALALVLGVFWRNYRRLVCTKDPMATFVGLLVGVLWVAAQPTGQDSAWPVVGALPDLDPGAQAAWLLLSAAGFMVLVPIVEELFFRGYLLDRLTLEGPTGRIFAVLASSAPFALLHDRWLEAWLAGIAFSLVMMRKNRLGDAILAHMAANSFIAIWSMMIHF